MDSERLEDFVLISSGKKNILDALDPRTIVAKFALSPRGLPL